MLRVHKLAVIFASLLLGATAFAAESAAESEGVAPGAAKLHDFGHGWAITNSMATGWALSLVLVVFLLWLIGKPSVLPSKGQAVVESLIEALRDLFEPIVGKHAFPAAFPVLITLFIFILFNNWSGLLPGVGTIGWGHGDGWRLDHITTPLIRPLTSDFNGTIALAIISFGAWLILVLKYAGPSLIIKDLFANKADKAETPAWLYPILSVVFLMVGFIEVFSIMIRPFTLSVRLFGNVFGGENLLHGTSFFFIFYFMELLVGLIQAVVFTLLTSVYIGLLCNHGDEHAHDDHGHAADSHH